MPSDPPLNQLARLDFERRARAGIPEAVFGQGKTPSQVTAIAASLAETLGRAVVTRLDPEQAEALRTELAARFAVDIHAAARVAVVRRHGDELPSTGGRIAVLAAGTADIPVAEEARIAAEQMGCEVLTFYDVGVAGVHRLVEPIEKLREADVAAVVVAAGMEGALPTVVKGLVPVPVIGVPTSIGYGYGGGGKAALMSMLQSCSPGLTVVNIDNGFGAGATAALIANRRARPPGADKALGERLERE